MDATVTINVNEQVIRKIIKSEIKSEIDDLKKEELEGITWSLNEFRAKCVGGKARPWVKLFIFDNFADEIVVHGNKGWLVPAQGKGTKNIIFASRAKAWMEANRYRIDWRAKLP